jgi:hypothetical protein
MILIKFYYHALMAWYYNKRAARYAVKMRWSETQSERSRASQKNLQIGSLSNHHERLRDEYAVRIHNWLDK